MSDSKPRVTVNTNYLCTIQCKDRGIKITANLPAEYQMDFGASYEEAFSQGLSGLIGGYSETIGKSMKMLGLQLTTKALTAQVWQGSTEISFSLPLVFQVENDEEVELLKPLRDLYSLVLPIDSGSGGLLRSPGPQVDLEALKRQNVDLNLGGVTQSLGDTVKNLVAGKGSVLSSAEKIASEANKGIASFSSAIENSIKNNISLQIGNNTFLKSVVITQVSATTHVRPLDNGIFQRVEVNVGFKSFYVLTDRDLPDLIPNYSSNGGSPY